MIVKNKILINKLSLLGWAWKRDSNGFILPDPRTFPSGIKALADYGNN